MTAVIGPGAAQGAAATLHAISIKAGFFSRSAARIAWSIWRGASAGDVIETAAHVILLAISNWYEKSCVASV